MERQEGRYGSKDVGRGCDNPNVERHYPAMDRTM